MDCKEGRIQKRCIQFCGSILIILCMLIGCNTEKSSSNGEFESNIYEIFQIDRSEILQLTVEYLGVSVELEETYKEEILDCFENAICQEMLENEPFTPSEYKLTIYAEPKIETYEICWFGGLDFDEDGKKSGYVDRRFDVYIDGKWYVFMQDDEKFWNEDYMNSAFKKSAEAAGVQIPSRDELEGVEGKTTVADLRYCPDNGRWSLAYPMSERSAEEILQEAECVILGKCVAIPYILTKKNDSGTGYTRVFDVEVMEILKGDLEKTQIYLEPMFGKSIYNGVLYNTYPSLEEPDLQIGEEYLLCISPSREDLNIYQLFDSIEGCARVSDDVTYPRYNTEYHPFYKVEIDDIREYCKD